MNGFIREVQQDKYYDMFYKDGKKHGPQITYFNNGNVGKYTNQDDNCLNIEKHVPIDNFDYEAELYTTHFKAWNSLQANFAIYNLLDCQIK